MTLLQVMAAEDASQVRVRTTDDAVIKAELARYDIAFDRWPVVEDAAAVDSEELLARYTEQVAALNESGRYRHIDIARIHPDDADPGWPDKAKGAREKFLDEHRHAEDEVRYFAAGRGCFYLHLGAEVLAVVCEGGDLLSVPAGTPHWFDMGEHPHFVAIRLFNNPEGWVANFTGEDIAERFPRLED